MPNPFVILDNTYPAFVKAATFCVFDKPLFTLSKDTL